MSQQIHTVDTHSEFSRMLLVAGHQTAQRNVAGGFPAFQRPAGRPTYTSTFGTKMILSGSLVGLAICAECTVWQTTQDAVGHLFVDNSEVLTVSVSVTGTGKFTAATTQKIGTDVFDKGALLAIKFTIGVRVSETDEVTGLDISEHGESAYRL